MTTLHSFSHHLHFLFLWIKSCLLVFNSSSCSMSTVGVSDGKMACHRRLDPGWKHCFSLSAGLFNCADAEQKSSLALCSGKYEDWESVTQMDILRTTAAFVGIEFLYSHLEKHRSWNSDNFENAAFTGLKSFMQPAVAQPPSFHNNCGIKKAAVYN